MCLFLVLFIIIHNVFNIFLSVCQLEDTSFSKTRMKIKFMLCYVML